MSKSSDGPPPGRGPPLAPLGTVPPRVPGPTAAPPDPTPLVPMPVPRTRPVGLDSIPPPVPETAAESSRPGATESSRPGAAADRVIRGGAAADPSLDAWASPSAPPPPSRVGTTLAGRYRLERQLGAGGAAAVYLAESLSDGRRVAVKVLHHDFGLLPEVQAHFEREAAAVRRIAHPNVAGAIDCGRLPDGTLYLVLEYVAGASLAEVLALDGRMPPERALRIARDIAAALGAAHRAGIVHRDLKPHNVMLIRGAGGDTVKVVDFGVAQLPPETSVHLSLAARAAISGTPEYMAPEQAAGTIIDARADLYTLGIVLYEMLTGRPPFRGEDMTKLLEQQMVAPPPRLSETIHAGAANLTLQLLAKNPDHRPSTADEVKRRIEQMLSSGAPPNPEGETASTPAATLTQREPRRASPRATLDEETDFGLDATAVSSSLRGAVARRLPPPPVAVGSGWRWALLGLCVASVGTALALSSSSSRRAAVGLVGGGELDAESAPRNLAAPATDLTASAQARFAHRDPALAWSVAGHEHAAHGEAVRSVAAFTRALELDPSLGEDPTLVRALRQLALDPAVTEAVLDLMLERLGAAGVDRVYELWATAQRDPSRATLAMACQRRLERGDVIARATPALRVALELWAGTHCASYQSLLPRARENGDARSLPVLLRLARREGCGPTQQEDCFACLRGDSVLEATITAVAARPAPTH